MFQRQSVLKETRYHLTTFCIATAELTNHLPSSSTEIIIDGDMAVLCLPDKGVGSVMITNA